jgi:hypothetical protein
MLQYKMLTFDEPSGKSKNSSYITTQPIAHGLLAEYKLNAGWHKKEFAVVLPNKHIVQILAIHCIIITTLALIMLLNQIIEFIKECTDKDGNHYEHMDIHVQKAAIYITLGVLMLWMYRKIHRLHHTMQSFQWPNSDFGFRTHHREIEQFISDVWYMYFTLIALVAVILLTTWLLRSQIYYDALNEEYLEKLNNSHDGNNSDYKYNEEYLGILPKTWWNKILNIPQVKNSHSRKNDSNNIETGAPQLSPGQYMVLYMYSIPVIIVTWWFVFRTLSILAHVVTHSKLLANLNTSDMVSKLQSAGVQAQELFDDVQYFEFASQKCPIEIPDPTGDRGLLPDRQAKQVFFTASGTEVIIPYNLRKPSAIQLTGSFDARLAKLAKEGTPIAAILSVPNEKPTIIFQILRDKKPIYVSVNMHKHEITEAPYVRVPVTDEPLNSIPEDALEGIYGQPLISVRRGNSTRALLVYSYYDYGIKKQVPEAAQGTQDEQQYLDNICSEYQIALVVEGGAVKSYYENCE